MIFCKNIAPAGHLKRSLKNVARRIFRSPSCLLVGCESELRKIYLPFEKCLAVEINTDGALEIRDLLMGSLVATMGVNPTSDLHAEYEMAEQILSEFTQKLPGSMMLTNKVSM